MPMHTAACARLPCTLPQCRQAAPERRLVRAPATRNAGSLDAAGADASPPPPPPPPSVGIDLGTSNSAIAVVGTDGVPSLIPLPDTVLLDAGNTATLQPGPAGPRTSLPSVVAYHPNGSRTVGGAARRGAAADPANTVAAAKRLLGRTRGEVDKQLQQRLSKKAGKRAPASWPLAPGSGGEADAPVLLAPPALSHLPPLPPEAVAADVLRALLAAAAAADPAGRTPTRAVVSVPAYFSAAARAATLRAATAAGLATVRLVREPVAAAIGYGVRAGADKDETVLCLDLGGGTFDVCLLECGGGGGGGGGGGRGRGAPSLNMVEVLATGGDPALGGVDWDDAVVSWLGGEHVGPAGQADWASQPGTVAALRTLAEAAKVALSEREAVRLTLPVGGDGGGGGGGGGGAQPLTVTLTRARLDELAAPLYTRAALAVDEACYQAGVELGATVDAFRARQAERDAKVAVVATPDEESTPAKPARRRRAAAAAPSLRPKERPPVSRVLLVGAPTRAPGFRAFVRNLTGLEPEEGEGGVDPDAAVALGAAVQAAALDAGEAKGSGGGGGGKKTAGRDLVVLDVLQGALARALAAKALEEDENLADKVMDRVEQQAGGRKGGGGGRRKGKAPGG